LAESWFILFHARGLPAQFSLDFLGKRAIYNLEKLCGITFQKSHGIRVLCIILTRLFWCFEFFPERRKRIERRIRDAWQCGGAAEILGN